MATYDFTRFSSAPDPNVGIDWTSSSSIDLRNHYDNTADADFGKLVFAKSASVHQARVHFDDGIVLEVERAPGTSDIASFGLSVDLAGQSHNRTIDIVVEFDVIEAVKLLPPFDWEPRSRTEIFIFRIVMIPIMGMGRVLGWFGIKMPWLPDPRPFVGGVVTVATDGAMDMGVISAADRREGGASFQCRLDPAGGTVMQSLRFNSPFAPAANRVPPKDLPFKFLRSVLGHPLATGNAGPPWANNAVHPVTLTARIAAGPDPLTPAVVDVGATQQGAILPDGAIGGSGFRYPSATFRESLGALRFAGVTINIASPVTTTSTANYGPFRVRIRRMRILST